MAQTVMKGPDKSIFAMKNPPMWRILVANVSVWALSVAFWWRTLQIDDIQSVPSSRRLGSLTSDIAFLLGAAFVICALLAMRDVNRTTWNKWPTFKRLGLLALLAGIGSSAAAMIVAGQRIWALGN
jgi:hypothetical protein